MANSKFSGVGFASGQNSNSNSVVVGYESGQNRRWTLAELAAGLPGSSLQQVMNAGSVSTVTSQPTTIRVNSNSGNYSQLTFSGATPGDRATMQSEAASGDGSFIGTSIFGSSISWSTFGVGNRTIEIGPSNFQIRDDVTNKGIVYHSDYSANFTARSLVDKGYVDNALSTPNLQAVMTQGSSYQGPNVVKLQTDHTSGNQMIEFNANGMFVRDTQNSQGLVYWTDYSANFTTNSLVSKLYVDTRPTPTLSSVMLQNGNTALNINSNVIINTASGFFAELAGDTLYLNAKDAGGQVQLRHIPSGNKIEITNTRIDLFGDVRVQNDIQFQSDVLDTNGNTGTNGQALVSQGIGNGVEWTDVDIAKAFVTLPAGANASWTVKNNYNAKWNIGSGSVTLSITASSGDSGTLVVTTTTGSITWPANSNWPDATEPTLTANGTDIFSFLYDGTNYYWTFGQNFGA